MIKRIFIKQTLSNDLHAGPKAKRDTYHTLERLGYQPVTYAANLSNRLLRYLEGLKIIFKALWISNAVVLIENPIESWRFVTVATKLMRRRNNHLVLLIHDIESERYPVFPKEIEYNYINTFHTIIAHNEQMKAFLAARVKPGIAICTLGIFDYLLNDEVEQQVNHISHIHTKEIPWEIVFCGNLSREKSGYLYALAKIPHPNWNLNLYGTGFENNNTSAFLKYRGSFSPDRPLILPGSHFGLIWDGDATFTCTGIWGEYMRMNNPHKLSLYIAMGLPIIVWEQAAVAKLVQDNGIGLTISNLAQLSNKLSALTDADYLSFRQNIMEYHQKVTSGAYLIAALQKVSLQLQ